MHTEHRTISTSFPGSVDLCLLSAETKADPAITTPFLGIETDLGADDCGFLFESEPSQAEKDEIDVLCAAHPSLDGYKAAKLDALGMQVTGYLYQRYDAQRRESLLMYLPHSMKAGKTNRANLVQTAMDWTEDLHEEYVTAGGQVLAATTHAEVDAVVIDLVAFEAAHPDPHVTIPAVLAVPD